MYRLLSASLLCFSLLFFAGCNDNTPTSNIESEISVLQKGAPASSGVVIRFEGTYGQIWIDENSGLVLVAGVEDVTSVVCGGVSDWSILNFKDVVSPSNEEAMRILESFKGESFVSVWDIEGLDLASTWCEFFTNATLVAEGMGNFRYHDNDLLAWAYDSKNHNAYGFKLNGMLTTPDDQKKMLNFTYHAVWDGNDFDTLKENIAIKLK